ncbi:putative ribonuclease H-like domain-containing protein [Tanacetum coccineum]
MNQFCEMKGIKREFSVARTLQQNRVAKRKNKTLIEAARTMLADSLLPTTFWAEAVNTACYVQNRVLVTKPHNKTPYELLHGRPPSISFMRPFRCPVTILNTLDPLGIFDRRFNDGVLGSRPDWLFDIDLLTNSMNYEPITCWIKTNRNEVSRILFDAYLLKYILLPLLYDSPQSSEDAVTDDASKTNKKPVNEGERNGQEKEGGDSNKEGDQNVQDFRAELDNFLVQQKEGPDGYSFAFVKKYWGTIQKDLYDFVNLFFASCVMPNGANSSFFTLIPKVSIMILRKQWKWLDYGVNIKNSTINFLSSFGSQDIIFTSLNIYGIGVNKDEVLSLASNVVVLRSISISDYLGLPLVPNLKLLQRWKTLVDRFHMRLLLGKLLFCRIGGV